MQTDNELSLWELSTERLPFVRREDVRALCADAPVLTSPVDVASYLLKTEAGALFKHPVSKKDNPGYYARIKEPIDLSEIAAKAAAGVYADVLTDTAVGDGGDDDDGCNDDAPADGTAAAAGKKSAATKTQSSIWGDLRRLVKNAKVFNQPGVRNGV